MKKIINEYSQSWDNKTDVFYFPYFMWCDIRYGYTKAERVSYFVQFDDIIDAKLLPDDFLEIRATMKGMVNYLKYDFSGNGLMNPEDEYMIERLSEYLGGVDVQYIGAEGVAKMLQTKHNNLQENKRNNMKKNTIKLNESQLRQVIKESVKKVLNEEDLAAFDDNKWMKRKDLNAPDFRIENKYNDSVEILFRKYNALLNRLAKCGVDISIYEVRPNQICFNQMLEAIATAMHIEYKGEDSSDRNEEERLSITQLALGLLFEINNQCNMFLQTTKQFQIEIQKIIDKDRV